MSRSTGSSRMPTPTLGECKRPPFVAAVSPSTLWSSCNEVFMDSQSNIACVSLEETAVIDQFLGALFEPKDIVSVRFIETWTEDNLKKSQVQLRRWLRAEQLVRSDQ